MQDSTALCNVAIPRSKSLDIESAHRDTGHTHGLLGSKPTASGGGRSSKSMQHRTHAHSEQLAHRARAREHRKDVRSMKLRVAVAITAVAAGALRTLAPRSPGGGFFSAGGTKTPPPLTL